MASSLRLVPAALSAAPLSLMLLASGAGCVAPRSDYDDYVGRTTTLRGSDAGASDVVLDVDPTADFSGLYLAACLPSLAADPAFQFLAWAEIKVDFTKNTVDYTGNWLNEAATKFDKASFVGAPLVKNGMPLAGGKFKLSLAETIVPGECQRLGPSNLVVKDYSVDYLVTGKNALCGEIAGKLTSPLEYDFAPPGDFCVLKPFKEGDPLPVNKGADGKDYVGIAASEFHCP